MWRGVLALCGWVLLWVGVAAYMTGCAQWALPSYWHSGFSLSGQYGVTETDPIIQGQGLRQTDSDSWAVWLTLHWQNMNTPPGMAVPPAIADPDDGSDGDEGAGGSGASSIGAPGM